MDVSKLDAARRQLETAIEMFFLEGDPVAIHTLTGAARSVLRDLARDSGREGFLDAMFTTQIRPEYQREVHEMVVEAQNFFKHADRDSDQLLDFNPRTTEFLLLDSGILYESLSGRYAPCATLFRVWFSLANPHILSAGVLTQLSAIRTNFDTEDRRAFFAELLPVAEEWCEAQPGSA